MKMNVGYVDRVVRMIIAIVIAAIYFQGVLTGWLSIVLLAVALIFVVTGLVGRCPLYAVLNIKTLSPKEGRQV